jgi:hypothetical protein
MSGVTHDPEKLADDVFKLVEYDQGYSYISDGMGRETRESIIEIVHTALAAHERCVKKLRAWLKVQTQAPASDGPRKRAR